MPFWTSNIIRMISWLPLLGKQGLINSALIGTGVIHQPLEFLLFSDFSVVVAYVHIFTLFMIVPIFNSMSRIDRALFEAARDAGASRLGRRCCHVVHAADQERHRAGLDLRRHAGDGRFLHRQGDERRQRASVVSMIVRRHLHCCSIPQAAAQCGGPDRSSSC